MEFLSKLKNTKSFPALMLCAVTLVAPIIIQGVSYFWAIIVFVLAALAIMKITNLLHKARNEIKEGPIEEQVNDQDIAFDKYISEAEVYIKYGLHDKAIEALEQALTIHPGNIKATSMKKECENRDKQQKYKKLNLTK